jgi:hypothetical protein
VTIDARGKSSPLEADTHTPRPCGATKKSSTPELMLAPERDDPLYDGLDTQTRGVE